MEQALLPIIAAIRRDDRPCLGLHRPQRRRPTPSKGWGIPMATDIAIVTGVVAMIGYACAVVAQVVPTRRWRSPTTSAPSS